MCFKPINLNPVFHFIVYLGLVFLLVFSFLVHSRIFHPYCNVTSCRRSITLDLCMTSKTVATIEGVSAAARDLCSERPATFFSKCRAFGKGAVTYTFFLSLGRTRPIFKRSSNPRPPDHRANAFITEPQQPVS